MTFQTAGIVKPPAPLRREIPASSQDQTSVLQAAIDGVSAGGGGRVSLQAGLHICAGLVLKSGVDLHLEEGALLRPVPDYDAFATNRVSVIAEKSDRGMIVAFKAQGISVTGPGKIDAGGHHFIIGNDEAMGTFVPAEFRPRTLVFESCRNVRLHDIEVSSSPMWTLHLVDCEDLHIANVRISNDRRLPNTDGIVLDACRSAIIENCTISTADDGVCLKTSAGPDGTAIGRCENILVRGCIVASFSCALKIGTESFGDFNNISFEDCKVHQSNRGLGVFSRDGGAIKNVRFSRIELDCNETLDGFWGSGEALTVTVVDRVADRPAGRVENLVVEDVSGRMEGAMTLVSTSASRISNVTLSRIDLSQQAGTFGTGLRYDLRPTNADIAPSAEAAGRANAWTKGADGRVVGLFDYPGGMPALFVRGVDNLAIDRVRVLRPDPLPKDWNERTIIRQ